MITKQSLIVFVFLCTVYLGFGQSIFTNPITGTNPDTANPYTTGQTVDPNLNVSGIGRGSGITGTNANNRYNASSWDTGTIDLTAYFEFTLTPNAGYEIDFINFVYTGQASGTGPTTFAFRSSLDGYSTNIGTATVGGTTISLAVGTYQNITSPITFRFYAWGASASGGTFSINDFTFNGYVLSTTPSPELQLADNSAINQNCGYTIDFGTQALSTNTDLTFEIKNVGSADLNASSFNITVDYAIVSPTTPFTVTSGNSQTVTMRFTPTTNGTRTGTLTINNNDSDEGSCSVNLTGVGYTPSPEINVEGNLGTYPDISNGDSTPIGTDNTLFAAQFIGASQSKSYRINNEGTADLTLSGISIGGANPGDFTVSISPSNTIAPSTFSILEITFSPLASGFRSAIVSIANNDGDENPFTFAIRGTGNCVSSSLSISPSSGPMGTTITVTGTNFGALTTATLSGINASVTLLSSTTIEVIVPNNTTTGNLMVVNDLGCTSSILFNVIDKTVGGCEGGSSLSDLIISEVTDATTGGVTYVEIYNGTGSNVQLNKYSLEIYANGSATASGSVNLDPGNLPNNSTYVVAFGVTGLPDTSNTCSITGGNGQLANQMSGISGINKKDNEHDAIRLLTSGGTIVVDQFGVYQNNNWMDTTSITGDRGFNFRRLNTASLLPNPSFNINDWNIIDWAGSGQSSCDTNDYSDIGFYDFSTASPPTISTQPLASSLTCVFTATLSIEAVEGFAGSNPLAYQWYYIAPGDSDWNVVPNGVPYNGETTNVLDISNTLGLNGYQYYCQVRENDFTCYRATNAVRLDVYNTTWNGSTWSNGTPTLATIAILNGNYDTSTNGNLSACSLIVNNGSTLNIADGYNVEVENDLTVNGNIIVQPQGSFVQNNDNGIIDGAVLSDKTKIVVNKKTAPMYKWYEYTYWSSPVSGELINDALAEATPNRRFWFNAQNYLDQCAETNNDNSCVPGQDGIDDGAPYDWTLAAGTDVMLQGVGYASTHRSDLFFGPPPNMPPFQFDYTFEGPFNNGEIPVPVYRNDSELNDTNSNFIGNPYPSAISVDDFFSLNAYDATSNPNGTLEGVIYLWSQNTQPSATANGNQNLNFSDLDYAIINAGTGATAGGDGLIPDRFIPSGQGFFINYSNSGATVAVNGDIKTGEVVFNNAMRVKGDNNQFFRASNTKSSKSKGETNKLWINLTSDLGVFSQVLVGYVNGASNNFDGLYYDVPRDLTPKTASALYSLMPNDQSKYAIQGKDANSLNLDESIPLGFYTAITGATLYKLSLAQLKGDFLTSNPIYLKDHLMNVVHNLLESDYTFTSEVGEFNDRFEIVFKSETLSDIEMQSNAKNLTIIELANGHVQFKTNNNLNISSVKILDILGRTLYLLNGSNPSEVYDLSKLSQTAYIAKVELSNGQIITKRALKRR